VDTGETPSDRDLVAAVLAGTAGAFERLVRDHERLCWHILQRLVRDPEEARDLCQETFLRVHQRLAQYRHESPLKGWIGRIAYTIGLRHLEQRRVALAGTLDGEASAHALELEADAGEVEGAYLERERASRVHAAIDALPPLQRTLLTLYHLDELSIPEITGITGLPSGTIKSHLFRTRARLAGLLAEPAGACA